MSDFIQVELDAMNLYPRVAMMAGIGVEHVHKGFNELWAHCYRTKSDAIPAAMLAGFFPNAERALAALVSCGFIEVMSEGATLRIKGTGRYSRVSRSEAGRKGGQVTTAKLGREGGRFTKQTTKPDQANEEAWSTKQTTKHHQANYQADGDDEATKQTHQANQAATKQATKQTSENHQATTKHHQALYPRSDSVLLTENTTRAASAPGPCAVTAPDQSTAGAVASGAESSDPFRPQAFGEAWHDFAMRYPWPDVPTLSLIEPDARSALFKQAASEKRPPIVLLNELVAERQRYAVGAGGVH